MPTQEKMDSVAEILEKIKENKVAVMSTYIGINVDKVTQLRVKLREAGIDYKVYKNTLARRALQELGVESAADFMQGPTAWAFSKDPVAPAKILKDFGKEVKFVTLQGGLIEGKPANKAQMEALADLPSREQLLGMTVGTIAAPLRNLLGALSALPRNLVNVLDQVKKQKEESGAAA